MRFSNERHFFISLLISRAFALLNTPLAFAVKPSLEVGECTKATVDKVFTRWGKAGYEWGEKRGILKFASGLYLYLYRDLQDEQGNWTIHGNSRSVDIEDAEKMYQPNDLVTLCLKFIPIECRKRVPDGRGEIYSITNKRTDLTHFGHFGTNQCGGA